MRRRLLILVIGLGLVVLAAWSRSARWRPGGSGPSCARPSASFGARRFGAARVRLARLAERWPGEGEVEYWLGACEMIEGHAEAALAAWGRVPDRGPGRPRWRRCRAAGSPSRPAATGSPRRA